MKDVENEKFEKLKIMNMKNYEKIKKKTKEETI